MNLALLNGFLNGERGGHSGLLAVLNVPSRLAGPSSLKSPQAPPPWTWQKPLFPYQCCGQDTFPQSTELSAKGFQGGGDPSSRGKGIKHKTNKSA